MSKPSNKQNKTLFIAAILLFVAVVAFFGMYQSFAPQTTEGAKAITIQVVDDTRELSEYNIRTDAEFLIDAMKDAPNLTFSGYESQYGITLTAINGITANWQKGNAYWAIYVNDEMGNYGVSTQPVNDGDTFRFEYTSLDANA